MLCIKDASQTRVEKHRRDRIVSPREEVNTTLKIPGYKNALEVTKNTNKSRLSLVEQRMEMMLEQEDSLPPARAASAPQTAPTSTIVRHYGKELIVR